MTQDWSHISSWASYFDRRHRREHDAWLRRGRTGQGRFVVEGKNLSGAQAKMILTAARFVDCELADSMMNGCTFDEAEFVRCSLVGAKLFRVGFENASFEDCDFQRADVRCGHLQHSQLIGGNWSQALLERADFDGARIENVVFDGADAVDSTWAQCTIRGGSFRGTALWHKTKAANLGSAHGARFERCDFRGANLDGLRLKDTVFDQCAFYGVMGKPELQGDVTLIDPDVSEAYDGTSIVSARDLLARWSD